MKYFVATYTHPNEELWNEHLSAHIKYLEQLIKDKKLVASGPFINQPIKSAMLILKVKNIGEAQNILSKDPYTIQGAVGESAINEWDPFFGQYQTLKHKILLNLRKLFKS